MLSAAKHLIVGVLLCPSSDALLRSAWHVLDASHDPVATQKLEQHEGEERYREDKVVEIKLPVFPHRSQHQEHGENF